MAKILYVIGNGFDIFHDIPSSYSDYAQWLFDTCNETLDEIYDTFGDCKDSWWYQFEKHLADVEAVRIAFEIAAENAPNFSDEKFHDSSWYDGEFAVESKLEEVYEHITDSFTEWIAQLDLKNCVKMLNLNTEDSVFLSFNYTETLEDVYGIDDLQILHIHGRAKKEDKLILGHGSSYEEIEKANPEPEGELEYWETRTLQGAISAISKRKKDVENLIKSNLAFFERLNEVETIVTLGYSYSDTDKEYMNKICEMVDISKIKWIANAYNEDDIARESSYFSDKGIKNFTIIDDISKINQYVL